MRPLRLEMRAFGPFRGRAVVDFGTLPASLFLIAGPIGAGKTTILDALCYALYGESSGKGRDAGDLRSHHADPTERTEVSLDFSVGGSAYRVTRLPEQELRKKRGQGNTTAKPDAALWDRTGVADPADDGKLLAAKVRDVDTRVREILGFDAAQFRQVILLPQGQFRQFLSAGSKEREAILKVLFDVRRCEELERRLREAVQELEGRQRSLEAARREKLGEFASREELRLGVAAKAGEVAAVDARCRELAAAAAKAEEALREGRRIEARFVELAQAERTHAELQAKSGDMEALRCERALAERAQPVLPEIEALAALGGEIVQMDAALAAKTQERAGLAAAGQENERRLREHRDGEPRHERNIAELSRLEGLRPRVAELEQARRAKHDAESTRGRLAGESAAAETMRAGLEERSGASESELPALRAKASARGALEARLQELQRVERELGQLGKAAADLTSWTEGLAGAREVQEAAESARGAAEREAREMRSRWVRSQAAALAGQLAAGEPCPVCGSLDHPAPVRPTGDSVAEEHLEAAESAREAAAAREKEARAAVAAAEVKTAELKARVRALRESVGDHADTPAAEIRRLITAVAADRHAAREAAGRVTQLEEELAGLREQVKLAAESVTRLSGVLRDAVASTAAAAATVKHLEELLPQDLRSGDAIEQRFRSVTGEVEAYRTSLQALEREKAQIHSAFADCDGFIRATSAELHGKRQRAEQAAAALDRKLGAAGFANAAACRASARDERQIAGIREQLERFNDELQQKQGALDEARKKVLGLSRTELPPLELARTAAERELQAGVKESGSLQEQHSALAGRLKGLDRLEQEEAAAAARSEALREIAAAAEGKNDLKMKFSTYALAAYFDDVMTHTNRRLAVMSSGRYTLARATDVSGGGFKGLDLEVHDAHTDRSRPADTLSGGEGFLASLALALGLADSVQSAAGGYKLESVFIDEGFGSLDAESLELAQRCITDLQRTGRMVGLISHVEEMTSWTPARIVIEKTPRGSTIRS